jgi:hypothetical protein
MWTKILLILMFTGVAFPQNPISNAQREKLRKDAPSLQAAINETINSIIPGFGLIQQAKGTYLEGYGLVFNLEVALERPRNPFSSPMTPEGVRTIVGQRQKEVKDKLVELLKQRVAGIDSIGSAESVAIIVHVMNTNPVDLPDLPSQIVFSVRKQDILDFQENRLADIASRIGIREFR